MKIISKYKDYYDSIAGQKGIDNTIHYIRDINELSYDTKMNDDGWKPINFPKYGKFNSPYDSNAKLGQKSFSLFIVGFCGKIYIGCKVIELINTNNYTYNLDEKITYLYDINIIKNSINEYYDKTVTNDKDMKYIESLVTDKKLLDLFYIYKVPYFILYETPYKYYNDKEPLNLKLNGVLKEIEFYKVFDPFSAFQEIEMYISGVIGLNTNPIVEISDKHKIIGHGFDYKYSFRKEKEQK